MLWSEVTNSWHLNRNKVVAWTSSLPSGHPMTAIINSMYNCLAFRYCFYRAVNNCPILLSNFSSFVYMCALGDDNVFSVHPNFRNVFNEITICGFMKELGLTYTSELKEVSSVPLRQIEDISFLKRSFRKDSVRNIYVAPLELSVILEMPYWTKKNDSLFISRTNVETSLSELTLHGEDIFKEFSPMILKASETLMGFFPKCSSFNILLEQTLGNEYNF